MSVAAIVLAQIDIMRKNISIEDAYEKMCKDTSKCIISTVGKIVDIIKKEKLFSTTKEEIIRLDLTGERCSSERQRSCNDNLRILRKNKCLSQCYF